MGPKRCYKHLSVCANYGMDVVYDYVHVYKLTQSKPKEYVKRYVYLYYIILAEYQYGTQRLNIKTLLSTAMLQWRLSVDKMERCTLLMELIEDITDNFDNKMVTAGGFIDLKTF